MKHFLAFLLILTTSIVFAQDFYDLNDVQIIEVTFAQSNWDQLMDNAYASDAGYIMATSVTINGITYDSIGVKYKGNSSYSANQTKNPWHIELNTFKDHEYEGYTDIKLANGYNDPSFLRDVLAYQIIGQYMDAPTANFANLYVNGQLIGLYSNTESVSKKFMEKQFGSKENTRFKCSPPDGASPQSNDFPNLVYMGQDSTDYYDSYELKSDVGWQELIDLCDTLNNNTDDIDKMLDVDRVLWMLAFDNVIVNLDSYIGLFKQNYYLYRSDFGQFLPIIWDLNESFGVFSQTGSINLNNTQSKQQMTHLLHENDPDHPLVQKLLSIPTYKRMYLAHMKTILLENFDNGAYYDLGQSLQPIIDASVQADNNKFFTYNDFISNLTTDIGGGGGPGGGGPGGNSTIGITSLMNARSDYLLGLNDFTQAEPSISAINISNPSPSINETITITANVTEGTNVLLGFRNAILTTPFTRIQMYDDGAHNDGEANDGVYGMDLALGFSATEYYIYAENENIGMFSPRRAEYEYYTINASSVVTGDIVINEFMASNDTTITDQNDEYEDWIELYNNGTESIDLSGYFLSDNASNFTKWVFPSGTTIEPNGYLIVWADEDEDQEGLHANFKLSASGESIILSTPEDATIVDLIEYTEQTTDASYARIPNGIGEFQVAPTTFNNNNDEDVFDCSNFGGDADNDGICADDDCNDSDASIGATQPMGTTCDDENTDTINDVILADGCTCEGTIIELGNVVINEFMASNETTVSDQDDEYEDWIELYNNGTESINLSGYYLSDNTAFLTKWTFPEGTIIAPDGFLIVWADEDEDQEGLHSNFKLSASGESIILSTPLDSTLVDAVDYVDQTTDVSYARIPNGTGNFQVAPTTFNANNDDVFDCSNFGGDDDNDGICADDDCDDSDASIGATQPAGTACDDGNPNTTVDVILTDGCTCEGSIVELTNIVINEFMASNEVTEADQDGEFDDWIELYNNGTESVDISGFYLTDDAADLIQWTFPEGTIIAPNGYLTIWADEDEDQEGLHADFKLSASGESIILSDTGLTVLDALDYPEQTTDISYGRFPNGTGDFQTMNPTFNGENNISTNTTELEIATSQFKVYPNPAENYFHLEYTTKDLLNAKLVTIYDMTGAIIYNEQVANKTTISTIGWAPGMYIISSEDAFIKLLVQ